MFAPAAASVVVVVIVVVDVAAAVTYFKLALVRVVAIFRSEDTEFAIILVANLAVVVSHCNSTYYWQKYLC